MVAIAAHAVSLGHKVNYYTLELGEDYVGKRFDCYFTGHSIDEVNKHRKEVQSYIDNLKGKLIVKEYPIIDKIKFKNNDRLKKEELLSIVDDLEFTKFNNTSINLFIIS